MLVASMLSQETDPAFWPRDCSSVERSSEEVIPKIREENTEYKDVHRSITYDSAVHQQNS